MAIFSGLGRWSNAGLLIMRAGLGVMMVLHGYPKLIGGPDKWLKLGGNMADLGITFYPVFWGFMAAVSEALGGVLVALGLAFRPACLFLMLTMAMASFVHLSGGDGIMDASHALELGFVFLGLLFVGPGRYSMDKG
jgi:putative oxidoreductase